jgi:DNA-binding transcriptional MocR family regulator
MFLVWIWLLTYCDENGKVTAGRDQIAREIGISSSSVQRAISNLKSKMTAEAIIKPNSVFTEFHILNWDKYQRNRTGKRTASEQQANSKRTLIKNKNKNNIDIIQNKLSDLKEKFPTKDVAGEFEKAKDWLLSTGKKYKDYEAFFRGWLRRSDDKQDEVIRRGVWDE